MPHRMDDTPPSYNPHMGPMMRGRPPHPALSLMVSNPRAHMIHPTEAARLTAMQSVRPYGGHPAPLRMLPGPMWYPADTQYPYHPDPRHQFPQAEAAPKRIDQQMESAEETAASALLMASTASQASPNSEATQQASNEQPTQAKKRKKHLDVLRRNMGDDTADPATPCQVSPVSASSIESHDGYSEEGISIATQTSRTMMMLHEASSSGSYDERMKKAVPPEPVDEQHFPSILHKVLSETDAQTVLQWLPHGQAWKIVRWDALRREVLPRCFPELCQEKGGGSIDSFLAQVRAWGFEEIKDGPDAGAYRHISFVRGSPKLCKNMAYTVGSPKNSDANASKGDKSHLKVPKESILRVPSLASDSLGDQDPKHASPEQQRLRSVDSASAVPSGPGDGHGMHERGSPLHHGWPQHGGMGYRSHEGYALQGSPLHHGVTFPPPFSPRFPFRTYPSGSPLKSGRGGNRLSALRLRHLPAQSLFPVSQRGKGNRRVASPRTDQESPVAKTDLAESESSGFGPHLQKDVSAVVPISRKIKRKLPLARKTSQSSDAEASQH